MAFTPHGQRAKELIEEFPQHGNRTLAHMLEKEFEPTLTTENAREVIRYYRGSMGKNNRKVTKHSNPVKTTHSAPLSVPEPHMDGSEWEPVHLRARRVLILSDVHLPYHAKKPLEIAIQHGVDSNVDAVLLNGDFMDFYSVSRHEKDPRQRRFDKEIEMGREMLQLLRETFKGCQIWWKLGNHEERWETFMWRKAPELVGISDFEVDAWMHTDKYNVKVIRDQLPIRINRLTVLHGHEYRWAISNPVNAARGMFMRAQVPVLSGHLHQTSEHTETNLHDKICTCWSSGCLMNLHPRYSRINPKWNHGFAVVDTTGDDDFTVHNKRIWRDRVL